MRRSSFESSNLLTENKNIINDKLPHVNNGKAATQDYKLEIKWINVLIFAYLHGAALYSFRYPTQKWATIIIAWIYSILTGFGTTIASHRYFTHRTFKANGILKFLLIFFQTMTAQEPILHWARDHRVHHKFTDTDADPYNSQRGFFFSHMGWLMCKKHPEVIRQGKKVDMSDLKNDPWLKFQKRFYMPASFFLNFMIPIFLGLLCGDELHVLWYANIYRFMVMLHCVWCVNSLAHFRGSKPYDKNISPTDSRLVAFLALGEGWHNYHHVFPWDYRTSETSNYRWNLSTAAIDFFAWLGWATELKTVPDDIIRKRVLRTGDGSHPYSPKDINNNSNNNEKEKVLDTGHFWGFGDKEMSLDDMKYVKVL